MYRALLMHFSLKVSVFTVFNSILYNFLHCLEQIVTVNVRKSQIILIGTQLMSLTPSKSTDKRIPTARRSTVFPKPKMKQPDLPHRLVTNKGEQSAKETPFLHHYYIIKGPHWNEGHARGESVPCSVHCRFFQMSQFQSVLLTIWNIFIHRDTKAVFCGYKVKSVLLTLLVVANYPWGAQMQCNTLNLNKEETLLEGKRRRLNRWLQISPKNTHYGK